MIAARKIGIDYDHSLNTHSTEGPKQAFTLLLKGDLPSSVLDVGCGTGTWLKAALEAGVKEIFGIDGVDIASDKLLIPKERFSVLDLTKPIDLGRRFDLALCLEVAEHLELEQSATLIKTLTRHSDTVVFSAAAPGQPGQHHVNCQEPSVWQKQFNDQGYVCYDHVRWRLWNERYLEPWYRQNIFMALKSPSEASKEPRIQTVVHPEMLRHFAMGIAASSIEDGSMPTAWYLKASFTAIAAKVRRRLGRSRANQ